jgi:acyl-coenzyme A synthetase/AMP-(fatty) acid ligase
METSLSYPLLTRGPADIICILDKSSPFYSQADHGKVTASGFWSLVVDTASRLPNTTHCINVCENRFAFLVSFCAVLLRHQTNVFPPNVAETTLSSLAKEYSGYVLSDETYGGLTDVHFNADFFDQRRLYDVSHVAPDWELQAQHIAAVCYTSGSTGAAKPIIKTWETFFQSSQTNRNAYLHEVSTPINLLATVASRHMWGFETTALLALHHEVTLSESHPMFPADIKAHLEKMPAPRVLVSTPTHLKALNRASTQLPKIERTLSATAPLQTELAQAIESLTQGDVMEIYGCSEMGSMAWRIPTDDSHWTLFDGFSLETDGDTGETKASANHIRGSTILGDVIECESDRHFFIRGRNEDLINIAGKRGSLAELNNLLSGCPGVVDGVIFDPAEDSRSERLGAFLVLDTATSKEAVIRYLREHVDPVFIPRPIFTVDSLPRNENGKLSSAALRQRFNQRRLKAQSTPTTHND